MHTHKRTRARHDRDLPIGMGGTLSTDRTSAPLLCLDSASPSSPFDAAMGEGSRMDRMRSSVKHAKVWGGQKNGLLNEATTRVGRSQVQLSATDVEAHELIRDRSVC